MFKDKYELNLIYQDFFKRVTDLKECLNVENLKLEIEKLEEKVNEPDFWNDNIEASKILKKIGNDKGNIEKLSHLESLVNDYNDLLEMDEDEEVSNMLETITNEISELLEKMELAILLSGPLMITMLL